LVVATDPCDDFSKTVQNTPFKKSSLNQQYREVVVAAATRSLHTSCNNRTQLTQSQKTNAKKSSPRLIPLLN